MPETTLHVAFDTNVVLDVLLERQPWVRDAAALLDSVARGHIRGGIPAHAATTLFYLYRKGRTASEARTRVRSVTRLLPILSVGHDEVQRALNGPFSDVEDGVVYEAARSAGCQAIVTRNGSDFSPSTIRVYSPSELRAELAS